MDKIMTLDQRLKIIIKHQASIKWPDPLTERRDKYGRRVRDCPECCQPIVRKFT